ncbi:MAG: tetratricopeptide repeat protein [Vulcanimicrobiota bacterium]
MKKNRLKILITLCILMVAAALAPLKAQDNLAGVIEKTRNSVVIIGGISATGQKKAGTGFFVTQSGEIITNRHVLYGMEVGKVKTASGKIYDIQGVVGEDINADLVRIKIDNREDTFPYLDILSRKAYIGEKILVIGNPLGLEFSVSDGIVSGLREIPGTGEIIQITAPVSRGSSGSPVVDRKGQVIGIATFQMLQGQNLNFAIPGSWILIMKNFPLVSLSDWSRGKHANWDDSAESYYHRGFSMILMNQYTQALPYFKKAVELKPDYTEGFFKLGYTLAVLGRYREAIDAFEKVISLDPGYADAYFNLGVAYGKIGNTQREIEAYKNTIKTDSSYAKAYFNLALVYGQSGEYNKAELLLREAIKRKKEFSRAYYNLGVTYGKLGRSTEAIEAYKQAIRLEPDDARAHYNLGVLFQQTGQTEKALVQYKILMNLDKELAQRLFGLIYE